MVVGFAGLTSDLEKPLRCPDESLVDRERAIRFFLRSSPILFFSSLYIFIRGMSVVRFVKRPQKFANVRVRIIGELRGILTSVYIFTFY